MSLALALEIDFTTVECGECGGVYALTTRYHAQKRNKGGFWNCPYCQCGWGFNEDCSEFERLRREKRRAEEARDYARNESAALQRQLSAQKGVTTKLRKRVKNGVCPCCNRTFVNLKRHMASKHPEYEK